jgi:glycine/D-amino acid oxidase-like deaminating enzyme
LQLLGSDPNAISSPQALSLAGLTLTALDGPGARPPARPILGRTEIENFHISAGWGAYGFKAAPIVGKTLAELVHTGHTPELIAPFALERFYEDRLVSELATAAVSH